MLVQACGLAGSGLSVAMWAPQAVRVWRLRHDTRALAGLSVHTQGLVILSGVVWALYAVLVDEVWVGVPGVVNMPIAVATAWWVHRAHRTLAYQYDDDDTVADRSGGGLRACRGHPAPAGGAPRVGRLRSTDQAA